MPSAQESLDLHHKHQGKLGTVSLVPVTNKDELSLAYTPYVAAVCKEIVAHPEKAKDLTLSGRTIAVITDGTAVLGLGDIGPAAAMPVMEGKSVLIKQFSGLDSFPICLNTKNTEEIIQIVTVLAPTFAGINLEDISAPRCFEIEERLQNLGIPVMHDDQWGTAIVVRAGLKNAAKVLGKQLADLTVVVNGSGAAGIAIMRMLSGLSGDAKINDRVQNIIAVDSKGIISATRTDLTTVKQNLLTYTNTENLSGTLQDALKVADVFIGVSVANLLTAADIRTMKPHPIIFALANPTPEIMPEVAKEGGAAVVATGRSDFPNQVNNLLAFPGIFKGAISSGATQITPRMKLAASDAIAAQVINPTADNIIPSVFTPNLANTVAEAVSQAAK